LASEGPEPCGSPSRDHDRPDHQVLRGIHTGTVGQSHQVGRPPTGGSPSPHQGGRARLPPCPNPTFGGSRQSLPGTATSLSFGHTFGSAVTSRASTRTEH